MKKILIVLMIIINNVAFADISLGPTKVYLIEENPQNSSDEILVLNKDIQIEESKSLSQMRPIISYGIRNYKTKTQEFESNAGIGLELEGNASTNLVVSCGATYNSAKLNLVKNSPPNYSLRRHYFYEEDAPKREVELENKNWMYALKAKYYLSQLNKVRPFLGVGIGYNRSTLNISDSNTLYNRVPSQDSVDFTYISSLISAGADWNMTDALALRFSGEYGGSLSNSKKLENGEWSQKQTNELLEEFSDSIKNSSFISISLGLVASF